MKLYINYNFCGYRWFVINDLFENVESTNIVLNEWNGEDILRIIQKMMLYDSYDVVFLQECDKYILALRHIHEQNHQDPDGRKLSMAYIFEAEVSEKDLLEKIMLVYVNHKSWLDGALSMVISSTIDHVNCNIDGLLQSLVAINVSDVKKRIRLGKGRVLALFSNWRDDTISNNLGLKTDEFIRIKYSLQDYENEQLIEQPNLDKTENLSLIDLIKIIKEKPQKKVIINVEDEIKSGSNFSFRQFFIDIKLLFRQQLTLKHFFVKYYSQIIFLTFGSIGGFILGLCF